MKKKRRRRKKKKNNRRLNEHVYIQPDNTNEAAGRRTGFDGVLPRSQAGVEKGGCHSSTSRERSSEHSNVDDGKEVKMLIWWKQEALRRPRGGGLVNDSVARAF